MTKQRLLNWLNSITKGLFVFLLLITTSCRSQINIYSNFESIKSTHVIKSDHLRGIIDYMLVDTHFQSWAKDSRKWLVISSVKKNEDIIVRVIPRLRTQFSVPLLNNDYSSYLIYKDVLIVYWGDEKLFFEPTRNKLEANFFEYRKKDIDQQIKGNDIVKINNEEYYGCEFVIKNDKLNLIEKDYFSSPLIK